MRIIRVYLHSHMYKSYELTFLQSRMYNDQVYFDYHLKLMAGFILCYSVVEVFFLYSYQAPDAARENKILQNQSHL